MYCPDAVGLQAIIWTIVDQDIYPVFIQYLLVSKYVTMS